MLDLILIRFYQRYAQRPIQFFGRVGLGAVVLSLLSFALMLFYKFAYAMGLPAHQKDFVETPLPQVAITFFLAGVQFDRHRGRRRDGDADLLRVAGQADVPARRGPGGRADQRSVGLGLGLGAWPDRRLRCGGATGSGSASSSMASSGEPAPANSSAASACRVRTCRRLAR